MEEKFTAVLASNERMLAMLKLLATSPERLSQQDTSTALEPVALHRRGTDATLVVPPTGIENEDQGMLKDDNARRLHELFVQIFGAWLNQMNLGNGSSESPDRSTGLVSPLFDGSTVACKPSQRFNIEFSSPKLVGVGSNHARTRRQSSPGLNPSDLPEPLSPTTTRTSDLSNESLYSDSIASTSSPSEASRQLLKAVMKGDIELMETLINSELKPDLEIRDPEAKRKMTPLLLAAKQGDTKTIILLHSKGAKLEAKDESGMTPLILAASLDKVEIMRELLARGADVRAVDKYKQTALHLAIIRSSDRAVSFLLNLNNPGQCGEVEGRKTVDINAVDKSGSTPLHYCAKYGKLDAAKLLLDRNACIEARDVAQNTPAYYAIKARKYDIVELLLARGADFSWPWPSDPTSGEIEKLLNRKGFRRPGLKYEKSKSDGAIEGVNRRSAFFSLPSPKFRRKSSAKVKEPLGAGRALVHS